MEGEDYIAIADMENLEAEKVTLLFAIIIFEYVFKSFISLDS